MIKVANIMQRNFLELDASTSITKAIAQLLQKDERYAVVFDKRRKPSYCGIVDRFLLIESKLNPNAKIGTFLMHPPAVTEETDIFEAAEKMYHSYPCLLPVIKKDKVIGVVRARDILALLPQIPTLAKLKVKEIKGSGLICFQYESRLGDVLNKMREGHFSHAPIIDKQGNIVSVFSLTDFFEKYLLSPEGKREGWPKSKFVGSKIFDAIKHVTMDTPIGDLASVSIFTISPTESLNRAVSELFEHKIADLIVVQNRKPISIITARDLLNVFLKAKAPEYWGIQFFGCENLPGQLFDSVREQIAEFYEKIKRAYFKDITYFFVQIKQYEKKEGKRKKYSVHLRLAIPAKVFNTEYAHFDLNTAVSWAIKAMDLELLKFKEKGKKWWTITGKHGKRQELGKIEKEQIEKRGRFIKPKLVKRK
jgi:CBS domain-containing protein/ribosome-associated translation inhibitor RaiA